MRNKRISDRVAQAILSGRAPESRPDLTSLANSIAEFREAAYESAARPSEELIVRLGLTETPSGSSHQKSLPTIGASKRGRTMFSWIAGLGIASKIALGATVAVAATAGAGAGGILPVGAQDAFDTVVSTVVSETDDGDESTEDSTTTPESESTEEVEETEHPDNFGGWVSERAKDPDKVGRTFGAETSEAAHEKNMKSKSESSSIDHDESEEAEETDDAGNDGGNSGNHGKSEKKQGGKSKP